jgi:arylsulfatase
MVMSWPDRIKDAGGVRNQLHHIIDIVPTILEATGVEVPQVVDGIPQKPMEGVSMAYTFDEANADTPSTRKTQYFEMIANRGIYHDGWYANTVPPHGPWILNAPMPAPKDYTWELYNLNEDYSQADDLAAKMPEKVAEMRALFDQEAAKYQVLPLNNDAFARALAPRPSATAGQTAFSYSGVMPGIPLANAANVLGRSYTVAADVEVPQGGGNGMLATAGGKWGGWALYLLNGKPVFHYNMLILAQYHWQGADALAPGKHSIVFDYTYAGPGIGKGGSGVLKVDGKVVATAEQANSIAFLQIADETFDVGVDTRSSVNEADYQVPFAFNGEIGKLTVTVGPSQLMPAEQAKAADAAAKAHD